MYCFELRYLQWQVLWVQIQLVRKLYQRAEDTLGSFWRAWFSVQSFGSDKA